jgi:hypothetical protein
MEYRAHAKGLKRLRQGTGNLESCTLEDQQGVAKMLDAVHHRYDRGGAGISAGFELIPQSQPLALGGTHGGTSCGLK